MNSIHQASGTINLGTQEESPGSPGRQASREFNREKEGPRITSVTASPSTGLGSADLMAESNPPAENGLPIKARPSLKRVLEDISASLGDLQAAVREAESQGEQEREPVASDMVAADRGYRDLFD